MPQPKLLAMLIKQDLEGDDALLRLGQLRFQEACLGAEIYPERPEQLTEQLAYCHADRPCTAHLPRNLGAFAAGRVRPSFFACSNKATNRRTWAGWASQRF